MDKVVEEVSKLPKPAELVEKLDEYVISKENAFGSDLLTPETSHSKSIRLR
ncbi:hypothetical protein [Vibrio hepatarius]|uniref:hypothetical protein n=1 Tax=Vibrio hepatarius TaxID=171383 RepID=UPI001C0896DD|nr:hypothetical protein [Vibrio hepatarius]MBU2898309.1 hypothetical protein [Vibrio hepatarius]